jgi:antitoxin ChpS
LLKTKELPAMPGAAHSQPRYKLFDLLAEMPAGIPLIEEWDEMPAVGLETG